MGLCLLDFHLRIELQILNLPHTRQTRLIQQIYRAFLTKLILQAMTDLHHQIHKHVNFH